MSRDWSARQSDHSSQVEQLDVQTRGQFHRRGMAMGASVRQIVRAMALVICALFALDRAESAMPPHYACESESEMFKTLVDASRKAGFDPEYRPPQDSGVSIQSR